MGCPNKLSDNMAIDGFLQIIFTNLKFPLGYLIYVKKLQALKNIQIQVHLRMLSSLSSSKCNEN